MIITKAAMQRRLEAQQLVHEIELEQGRLDVIRFILENNVTLFNQNTGLAGSMKISVDPASDSSIQTALDMVKRNYQEVA